MRPRIAAVVLFSAAALFLFGAGSAFADTTTTTSSTTTTAAAPTTTTTPLVATHTTFFPAGNITVTVSGTLKIATSVGPVNVVFTGTMKGTSDGSGHLTFPKSSIVFPPISVNLVVPATVHISATTDFTGIANLKTGAVTLNGSIVNAIDIPALSASGCPLGPINLHLSTGNSGGVKYSSASRTATDADTTFTIPKITSAPASCPAAAVTTINSAFPLPVTGSTSRSIVQKLVFFPPGTAAPALTSSSGATVAVAAESATATTAAPVAAAELPRTGSSTTPLALAGLVSMLGGLTLLLLRRRVTPS